MCMSAIVQTHVLVYAILLHHAILNRNQLALIAGSHAYNIDFKTLLMCTLIALLVDTIGVLPRSVCVANVYTDSPLGRHNRCIARSVCVADFAFWETPPV